jgi:hypothetical protein
VIFLAVVLRKFMQSCQTDTTRIAGRQAARFSIPLDSKATMKTTRALLIVAVTFCVSASRAVAQELTLYAGPLTGEHDHTYAWAIDYTEGFGRYFAGSITWLNEGHVPGHHRDGPVAQVWGRLPLMERRIVLALGVGPYRYFDTEAAEQGAGYSNTHGWGVVYSARATWYSSHRWTANLQLNHVQVTHGSSTTAIMLGVGYQLDSPDTPGPRDFALPRSHKVTNNEITLMAGATILNSLDSQTAAAQAIEYRRGLTNYLDATLGYLHEGSGLSARRDGATAQLWLTRAFLNDHFSLGIGVGAYAAIHHGDSNGNRDTGDGILSGLVSMSASYRIARHWSARVTWNRVMTRYSRDTDVILAGVGYRF